MAIVTEEKIKNKTMSEKELNYKIEIATQTLERNIGFVTNCDNKTSIVLTSFGVLLTIILTNEGLNEIFNIIKSCITMMTFNNILYLLFFASATLVMLYGMIDLGRVLVAKTSEEAIGRMDEKSRIFFAGIKKNGNYETYKCKFISMDKEGLLNDLIEQIYINSDIASAKYKLYNRGLRCTAIGFLFFAVILIVGTCIY